MRKTPLTFPELFALPTVVDLRTAARAVGISTTTAYRLISADRFPCPVMRPGRRYQIPTAGLLKALAIESPHVHRDDVPRGAEFTEAFDD